MAEKVLRYLEKQSKINSLMKNAAIMERDNARTIMLRDPIEVNERELALKQKKAKQIIRKNKKIWEKAGEETFEKN